MIMKIYLKRKKILMKVMQNNSASNKSASNKESIIERKLIKARNFEIT